MKCSISFNAGTPLEYFIEDLAGTFMESPFVKKPYLSWGYP